MGRRASPPAPGRFIRISPGEAETPRGDDMFKHVIRLRHRGVKGIFAPEAVLTFPPCLGVYAQLAAFRNLVLHIAVQPST